MLDIVTMIANLLTVLVGLGTFLLNTDLVKSNPLLAAVAMILIGAMNLALHMLKNKTIKKLEKK